MPPPLRIPDPRPVTPQAATTREATPRPRLETLEDPPILRKYRSVSNLANPPDSEREGSPSQSGQGIQPQTTSVVKAVKVLSTKKQRGNRLLSGLSADNILESDEDLQDQTKSAARARRSTRRHRNCKNQHLLGLLDLATHTTCEKLAAEPKPRHVNYSIYAMKKDTIPSSGPVDLSDADCERTAQTLSCNGNPMNGPKDPIISFHLERPHHLELGADRNKGYESKNHMTVIWNAIDQSPKKKECEYQLVANDSGTMYKLEKTDLRLRDPTEQVEFILSQQSAN
ncbi:hypothetical protein RvY_17212 [Ramazzottius varieornatus]|uniref:Uncharacterized protein n=1 Tax=Ramazzottius varieornatus TaxID=947166 RepID=A0A1D1W3N5_RAMVA|nr:hypothetical protein RvY_17212 [Ramazzottius varieornatus]